MRQSRLNEPQPRAQRGSGGQRTVCAAAHKGKGKARARQPPQQQWSLGRFLNTFSFFNSPTDLAKTAVDTVTAPLRAVSPDRVRTADYRQAIG